MAGLTKSFWFENLMYWFENLKPAMTPCTNFVAAYLNIFTNKQLQHDRVI